MTTATDQRESFAELEAVLIRAESCAHVAALVANAMAANGSIELDSASNGLGFSSAMAIEDLSRAQQLVRQLRPQPASTAEAAA